MYHNHRIARTVVVCGIALSVGLGMSISPLSAFAVTSAEKQAEADAVMKQIDTLQTNLNQANEEYEQATAAHDEAVSNMNRAQAEVETQSRRVDSLQEQLSHAARGMYRSGGASSFVDVLLGSASFEEFLSTWDAVNTVTGKQADLVQETKDAREKAQAAQATYEEESKRAEEQMNIAQEKKQTIEQTQASLKAEAEKLTQEAAELQAQEELEAEQARLAAEAAKKAEEEMLARQQAQASSNSTAQQYTPGASVVSGNGQFAHPLPGGSVSSGFGYRDFLGGAFHKGVDFAAAEGTPYYAADSGTVIYATNDGSYNGGAGNWIVIAHGNGLVTKYMHSSAVYVSVGQHVDKGQNIGAVGNTGQSFGAHLHFQVETGGVAVNPLLYL